MALAGLAWFPVVLTSPVLLAVGANRDRVLADLIGRSVAAVILCSAAFFGILAMAASKLVTLPFQMVLSLWIVRRHVPFAWGELRGALWKSAAATAGCAVGPVGVLMLSDTGFDLSIAAALAAALLAGLGWLAAILLTQHPVVLELRRAADQIFGTSLARWRAVRPTAARQLR
jgi:O-antigen/teichoic acid export membrane protein